jgi:hypothetical protein
MSKYGMRNVPMRALDPQDCIWPVNSPPPGGVFIFCADVCQKGSVYCSEHLAQAYQRGRIKVSEAA